MLDELGPAMRWHRPLMAFAGAMVVTGAGCALGYAVDERTIDGVSVWLKPLKFTASFAVYAGTLAWLISRLDDSPGSRTARRAGTVIAVAAAGEVLAIVSQAARGRRSHFNTATALDAAVYAAMGALVVIVFVATVAVGVALLRRAPGVDRVTRWALGSGLAISLAGMAVGFLMVSPRDGQGPRSPVVGGHGVGAGGDLRVPHFVGMHALQVLPLLAAALLVLPGVRDLPERVRLRLMVIASGGYAGAFGLALWQALRGQAVTSPDRWTAAAATALAGGAVAAAWPVLWPVIRRRGSRRSPAASRR